MKMQSSRHGAHKAIGVLATLISFSVLPSSSSFSAEDVSLLRGRVTSQTGEALAGIPVKAHRNGSTIGVAVYTGKQGEYSFPSWSDVTPGAYSVSIELPDFERAKKDAVRLAAGKTSQVDFALKSKPVAYEDATASEIIAGLPGTDRQKVLFSQCGNCHTLQWALQAGRTRQDWIRVVTKMAGRRASEDVAPDTYAFSQKQFIEPLADYLTSIRGPDSSGKIPFKPRPRPTGDASTNIVITEYDLPRGGQRELYMLRGDPRFVWPHDVIVNAQYAYYTDHFSFALGRLDRKTGQATEIPFTRPISTARDITGGDGRPGNPGGGAHELQFDRLGNVIIGMGKGTVKYDPNTGKFTGWPSGSSMFGLDPKGNVWHLEKNGQLTELNTGKEAMTLTVYPIPKNHGIYDIDTDSKGRTDIYIWRENKIAVFDPKDLSYAEYKMPTPMSGPRRGQIDAQNRLWVAEFYSGQVAMVDPDKKRIKEYPLIENAKPYTAPYAEPYAASVDDRNQLVWTNDFSSSRIYKLDIKTGKMTEYMTPSNYEARYFKVETDAPRPTVWIPAYRPPSKLVKIQVR